MPKSVLTRKRSLIARIAILAMIFSLMAVALPASAHSVAIDATGPCPAATPSAGFTDIGGLDATTQTAINCLFAFGITTGTSATTYSPNDTVTRWQMALFLVRQAADHGLTIPAATSQGYTDIGGLDASTQNAINQITQLGISKGTSSTTFSPTLGVSRWQMALFIYRLGVAAGVTFTDDPAHNEFTDIGETLAEAQTAINALADRHVALGTGGSAFSPDLLLNRWQMALFLTRLLAADGIAAAAGLRVSVVPTAAATLSAGNARAYTATFKNADGTNYTGFVGIQIVDTSSGAPIYNDTTFAAGAVVVIESVTDGLLGVGTAEVNGLAGSDGRVDFVVRHSGAAETVLPVAWEDLDNDLSYESVGNVAPGEPFGLGGTAAFTGAPANEAVAGAFTVLVTKTTPASDSFEGSQAAVDCDGAGTNAAGAACTFNYDSGDVFLISGASAPDLAAFEAALNSGDTVTVTYDPDTADQSTFNISNNTTPGVVVTSPAAATTVDAATFTLTGTATPGYTVVVYRDDADLDGAGTGVDATDDNEALDAGEAEAGQVTVLPDGTWSLPVVLLQVKDNFFIATQRVVPAAPNTAFVDVPTITESSSVAPRITLITEANGGALGVLDAGDSLAIDFNEAMTAPGAPDSLTFVDLGGDVITFTCGSGGTTCTQNDTDTITVVIGTPTSNNNNDNGFIDDDGVAQVQSASGWVGTDGNNLDVPGSGAARVITGF